MITIDSVNDFRLQGVTLRQLEYLVAVADTGSVSGAAAEVAGSQPAVSHGIRKLQSTLGVQLLERRGAGVELTPIGAELVALARDVLRAADRIATAVFNYRHGRAQPLRLGAIDAAVLYLFAHTLAEFRLAYAGTLSVRVSPSSELVAGIATGALDMAIVVGPSADVAYTPLVEEELVWYARAECEDAALLYPADSRTRAVIDRRLRQLGQREPVIAAESGNPEVLLRLAELGLGWTVLPRSLGSSSRRLTTIRSGFAKREIGLIVRTDIRHDGIDRLESELTAAARDIAGVLT